MGVAIFSDNSTLDVAGNNSFSNNSASYSGGGLYAVRSSLNLHGSNCFDSNHATRDGGGIYTREISTINLSGTNSFLTNSANRGGGILLEDSILTTQTERCPVYTTSCKLRQLEAATNTFRNNSAPDVGGGIAALNSSVTLVQSSFEDNSATNGGGLYTFGSILNFQGSSTSSNNTARIAGGGLSSIYSTVYMNGSMIFKANSAVSGGGMYLEDSILSMTGKNCFENPQHMLKVE